MKRNIIIVTVIILLITFISAINKPREVLCETSHNIEYSKSFILNKSKQGWRLTHLCHVPYEGTLIVMER